jgi:hypothetical protein
MSRALPTDEELLESLRGLYAVLDPPPVDLADGVLARLQVEETDMDYELLALVDSAQLAGVRGGEAETVEDGAVTLEFAGTSYQVLVRISTVDGVRRLDGWVAPAAPMDVRLTPSGDGPLAEGVATRLDENGRFEFPEVHPGRFRIWLLPDAPADPGEPPLRPFATLPFLV